MILKVIKELRQTNEVANEDADTAGLEDKATNKTSTEDDKTPKKRPTKDNTWHEQAIEMGKTFKNVAKKMMVVILLILVHELP